MGQFWDSYIALHISGRLVLLDICSISGGPEHQARDITESGLTNNSEETLYQSQEATGLKILQADYTRTSLVIFIRDRSLWTGQHVGGFGPSASPLHAPSLALRSALRFPSGRYQLQPQIASVEAAQPVETTVPECWRFTFNSGVMSSQRVALLFH